MITFPLVEMVLKSLSLWVNVTPLPYSRELSSFCMLNIDVCLMRIVENIFTKSV